MKRSQKRSMEKFSVAVLEMQGVSKSFRTADKEIEVLKGISMTLHSGEQVAIIGPSGSGKSTLLHVAGTLLKPTSGTVAIRGEAVAGQSDEALSRRRNRLIGFVFQFHHLHSDLTALENILVPMKIAGGIPPAEQRERALALLEGMALGHRLGHRPGELSGGEQQRVAVARALVMRPGLVLADEPTGNLDRESGDRVFQLLQEACRHDGTGLIVVTHHEEIGRRCTRRIQLVDGKIA